MLEEIEDYEKRKNIQLPFVYKKYYKKWQSNMPMNLVGTDFFLPKLEEFNNWANELFERNNEKTLLDKNDFVFYSHQGYIIFYFKLSEGVNPPVYGYSEIEKWYKYNSFSEFAKMIES